MKDLFLIRHAKSSWTDQSLSDIDRPLNPRGRRQVEAMAHPLLDLGALDGPVHVSHALRARQTMEGVLERLGDHTLVSRVHFDPDLYTFRWKQLYRWLKHHASEESALTLVGHNPALSDLAEALTGAEVPDMVTGAVLHLRIPVDAWDALKKGQAEFVRYLPPKHASYRLFRRKAPNPPAAVESLKKQVPQSLQYQLAMIRDLQPGVVAGTDPEFLHQFRVNLRRSRALTEALVDITSDPSLHDLARPLRRMTRQTGALRDLDVFLLYLDGKASEDPRLRRSLRASGAGDFFRDWRWREHHQLLAQLDSKSWRKGLQAWENAITGKALARALKKATPGAIHDTIRQRAAQCLHDFGTLHAQSPDDDFHDLRKALKRLRYLAELNAGHYRALLEALKVQQSLYGSFQDRHQQLSLLAVLAQGRRRQQLPPAVGELAERIAVEKQAAREAILSNPPRIEGNQ